MRQLERFYTDVDISPAEGGGYAVTLDGRPVRSPGRRAFSLPGEELAHALAAEWAAQGEKLDPATMPLTGMAWTATDLVQGRRDEVVAEIAAYAQTEMLCYRAEHPEELVNRQSIVWQPLLDWAAGRYGVHLEVTTGILPLTQPEESVAGLWRAIETQSDLGLAALAAAVKASGSLVVGLALAEGRINAEEAFAASELESTYQMELWGEEADAAKRRGNVQRDLSSAERLFRLLDSGAGA